MVGKPAVKRLERRLVGGQTRPKGVLDKVTLSTAHFIGNYPKHFSLDGMNAEGKRLRFYDGQDQDWTPILQEQALGPNEELLRYPAKCRSIYACAFTYFPDGGVSRLRVMGKVVS